MRTRNCTRAHLPRDVKWRRVQLILCFLYHLPFWHRFQTNYRRKLKSLNYFCGYDEHTPAENSHLQFKLLWQPVAHFCNLIFRVGVVVCTRQDISKRHFQFTHATRYNFGFSAIGCRVKAAYKDNFTLCRALQ